MGVKNQNFLKRENHLLVLRLIIKNHPLTRSDISKKTVMSFTSASRIVASLLDAGLIEEKYYQYQGSGRKATYLVPKEDAVISFGVELDRNKIRIGCMDFMGELIVSKNLDYTVKDPSETVQYIADQIREIIDEEAFHKETITGVCIGLPGLVNIEDGMVELSTQFGWRQVPLKQMIEKELGLPALVENELKLKAIAEYEQVDPSVIKDMVILGLGSGVGSVLISEGSIYRGKDNFAGEIGHTIVNPNGNFCTCGNFGCIQTYIAEEFLLKEASKVKPIKCIQDILREMDKGERWAERIIHQAVTYAAMTINNLVNIHNPHLVIVSGFLVESYPTIQDMIFKEYNTEIRGERLNKSELQLSKTKSKGIVIGAGLIMQQEYLQDYYFV